METGSQDWLKRAREGDAEAFAQSFEALRPLVYAVAARLAGPDDAEDVTMETFLRAWQGVRHFDGRASLKSWLYRIAHNCAIDFIRRRQRRREVPPETDAEGRELIEAMPDKCAAHPASRMEGAETRNLVERALRQLPDEHRVTLMLRYSDGLSYGEIAAATGVPIGTVMSRLFNGKRKMMGIWRSMDEGRRPDEES
ncbi:MAG: sigma-70 family RNA polymerase sigma factor [Kiritimatiellae bacterium]|nr:sigma-70 family RNA polymerase sigma factor [Kiritimatiellia bacterium]